MFRAKIHIILYSAKEMRCFFRELDVFCKIRGLLDGDPDGLAAGFGGHDFLLELVEPLARFQKLAYNLVAAYENAASGVGGGMARVDADALERLRLRQLATKGTQE